MKRSLIILLGVFCLVMVGCTKDADNKNNSKDPGGETDDDDKDDDDKDDDDKDDDDKDDDDKDDDETDNDDKDDDNQKKKSRGGGQENTKANLLAVFAKLQAAIKSGDVDTAAAITSGMLPNKARLKKALRDEAPAELVSNLLAMYERFGAAPKEKLARLLRAKKGQTNIVAHGATTEEIAANQEGSIVFKEFPGGAVRLAKKVLQPGVTFYEIEMLVPGEKHGMKYHLFYWSGDRWSMLGPAWRAARTKPR